MSASLLRIWTIARNTLTEVLRQRVLNVIFLFGLILLGGSTFFTQFSIKEQDEIKFLLNLGYAAISLTGLLVALMGTAQLIPAEIERRTIYTVLSKAVRRFEFIAGKYFGLLALLTLMVLVMSGLFYLLLLVKEPSWIYEISHGASTLTERQMREIQAVQQQIHDPHLIQVLLLIWAKLALVAVIALFFSTLATSTIFIVATTMLVYLVGHLQGTARDFWMASKTFTGWRADALGLLSTLVPDFGAFNIVDEILGGNKVPWEYVSQTLLYTGIYSLVLLGISALIFEDREL